VLGPAALATDPLLRYGEGHRLKIRAQARRLAQLLAAAIPPRERGPGGAAAWEDAFYDAILEQCAPNRAGPPKE
jgi:hypothetical protein